MLIPLSHRHVRMPRYCHLSVVVAILLLLTSVGLGAAPRGKPSPVVRLVADVWCPYNCALDNPDRGYLIELAEQAFGRLGMKIEYQVMPWSRALAEVSAGRATAAVGAVASNVPPGLMVNRVGLGKDQTVLVSHRERPFNYDGLASLAGLSRIGVIADYTYDADGPVDTWLRSPEAKPRLIVLSGESALHQLLRMLASKRIDALLENRNVALYAARRIELSDIIHLDETGGGDIIRFAFRDNASGQKLAGEFDAALQALDEAGQVAPILTRYGLEYTPLQVQP